MVELQTVHLSRSLHRPDTMAGCERKLFLSVAMVAFMLGGVGLTWWSVGMAVGLWVSLVALLRVMGKADPNLSAVYFNLIKYKPVYQARPYALEQQVQWK